MDEKETCGTNFASRCRIKGALSLSVAYGGWLQKRGSFYDIKIFYASRIKIQSLYANKKGMVL